MANLFLLLFSFLFFYGPSFFVPAVLALGQLFLMVIPSLVPFLQVCKYQLSVHYSVLVEDYFEVLLWHLQIIVSLDRLH